MSSKRIREVMKPPAVSVLADSTIQEAAERMKQQGLLSLPVTRDGKLVGVVTEHGIATRAVAEGSDPWTTQVAEVMTAEVASCFDDQTLDEVAQQMRGLNVRRLLVVDRAGRLVGTVTLNDVALSGAEPWVQDELPSRIRNIKPPQT